MSRILLSFFSSLVIINALYAEVTGFSENLIFRGTEEGSVKMKLTETGFAVGHNTPSANLHVQGNSLFESGNIMLGTSSTPVDIKLQGRLSMGILNISSNTLLNNLVTSSVVIADTSSHHIDITLPNASDDDGIIYIIKKSSANNTLRILGDIENYDILELTSSTEQTLPFIQLQSLDNQWLLFGSSDNISFSVE